MRFMEEYGKTDERKAPMERKVCPGEIYRHFKGKLYQIVAVARHSETGEAMVVYQALYGDFGVYVRPFDMFVGPVDREKYPDATQQYRFERAVTEGKKAQDGFVGSVEIREEGEEEPNPALMEFLEARGAQERMECLRKNKGVLTQADLESIYVVLDMKPQRGTIAEQIDGVQSFLGMQKHYEGARLR